MRLPNKDNKKQVVFPQRREGAKGLGLLGVFASSMRRLVKGIRMAEFHFFPNAVDVSLLSALFLGNLLPGAWKGPSSGCHLCGALDVPDAKRSHRDGTSAVHRKAVSSVSLNSLEISCETTLSVAERGGRSGGGIKSPKAGTSGPTYATASTPFSGRYAVRLFRTASITTANFRATATLARFFAFLPPRSAIRMPWRRRSLSFPNGPMM